MKSVFESERTVVFVVPTLGMGGMERVVSLLSSYAADKGIRVYIICLIKKDVFYNIPSRVSILAPTFRYVKGPAGKLRVLFYLISTLKRLKPNAVLAFSEVFNPLSIVAAKISTTNIYVSDRSSPQEKHSFFIELLRRAIYPLASGMISQTELAKRNALRRGYNKNITVIPNPVMKIQRSNKPSDSDKVIISVGRLIPTKNFNEMIDLFVEADTEENWQLWILGDGPERSKLQLKIDGLALNARVKLIGSVKDIGVYFESASIFAFTSLSEGFPNALSEALAYPLPCIAYDCPAGPSDLLRDGENGFLIKLGNRTRFITKLKIMMEDRMLRERLVREHELHRNRVNTEKISEKYLRFLFK